jgi:iron(III) transport system permease protein
MPLFTPGGFIHLTKGMNHECITQPGRDAARRVVCITALVIYVPLLFIVVQSFLQRRSSAQILEPGSFAFIFTDPDFYLALRSGFIVAFGLVIIATTKRLSCLISKTETTPPIAQASMK